MSLQVWLPLNGSLKNQGVSDVTVNGGTIDNNGKLGKCYLVTKTNPIIITQSISTTSEWTITFWAKLPSSMNNATAWEVMFSFPTINADTGANGTSNINWASYHNVKIWDDANHQWFWAAPSTNFNYDQWHHWTIAHTANGNGVQGKIYIDGNLIGTYNNTTHQMKIRPGNITIGGGISTGGFYINDFRIYNHCLSPKEVKELSKGLVLHYPLNRGGFGQDNLMPNSIEMPVGSANPSTGTWRLAGSSQMARSRVIISDAPSGALTYGFQSVGLQTGQDASCWGIDSFPRENGTTYTLSAWGRIVGGSSTAAMLGFSVYNGTTLDYGGTYDKAVSSDAKYYGSGAYDYAGGQLNPNGNWTRIYRTFTSTSASDNIYIGFNTAKAGSNVTLQLCGVKLEKGDKMTPWIPNNNESMYTTLGLNGTTEYDCSGFCNNGEKIDALTYTLDTPKYQVSTHIGATSQKIHISGLTTSGFSNSYSFTWWGKRTSNNPMFWGFSDGIRLNGMYIGTLWNTGDGSNNPLYKIGTTTQVTAPSVNVWHHYVMTGNGTKCYVYLDGELWAEAKTYKAISGTSIYINGWNSATDYCSNNTDISDFRIYATALSAEDVAELYAAGHS